MISSVILSVFSFCGSPADTERENHEFEVPAGFVVEKVAGEDLVDFPMFATLDERGRLFVFESIGNVYENSEEAIENPRFRIKLLEDTNQDGHYDQSTIFADKVGFPQGGVFYKGSLYASSAPDLLKFTDTNGDGIADSREVILSGWTLNVNANSLVGPFLGPDGWLYMTSAIMGFDVVSQEKERMKGETSRVWRVRPDGTGLEWVAAGGMNNPIELAFTPAGEPIGTMTYFTNPKAGQRDALIYWTEGGVYPKPNSSIDRDGLKRTGELLPVISKYSRVSPSGIGAYRNQGFGEDYENNMFSAHFNTHQVLRHRLIRDGATFKTEDEVFFRKADEDFHPTDVLEDADGSLLVVETGGWFIKGCPLSQVSKPEIKGGIYRVRKSDAKPVEDPYGNHIKWDELDAASLVQLLEDNRPFVRDRAEGALVDHGEMAVGELAIFLEKENHPTFAVLKSIFAMSKIGGEKAVEGLIKGLGHTSEEVRIATARVMGLMKEVKFVPALTQSLTSEDSKAAKRQIATALGQIKAEDAITSLLLATRNEGNDRMTEHAITYALIEINRSYSLLPSLRSEFPKERKTALIALDQMDGYQLSPHQIHDFLSDTEEENQATALWITTFHPEWAADFSGYIADQFQQGDWADGKEEMIEKLLYTFCSDEPVQLMMAKQLQDGVSTTKLFLLRVMGNCNLETFPSAWLGPLREIMDSKDDQVVEKTLALIKSMQLEALDRELLELAKDDTLSDNLRMSALSALSVNNPQLEDWQVQWLMGKLHQDNEISLRQRAAQQLSDSDLSNEQVRELAIRTLHEVDDFILGLLTSAFVGSTDPEVGLKLSERLMNSKALDSFNESRLVALFGSFPKEVDESYQKLMDKFNKVNAQRLEKLEQLEAHIPKGNLDRGRALYFGKAACSSCHSIGSEGGDFGPDLTSIQKDRSAHDLLEAILYPSATFVREYETYKITTSEGEYTGVIHEKSPDWIRLAIAPQATMNIMQKDILTMEIKETSMMPQGLDQVLTDQEMADLMVFLLGQDQDPELDETFLR
ncbi:PVC-type heme-binding CxxCH protein [Pleomorphovibrio marinus]|uniref:PVC-type heme-binding CxxCH protein n=1 Tax=Pleomorphovibrio marinus TaxID=2164132 RepID=UPI0018E50CE2|nr:PVC-type heme-binding CxxCH protein [Pleomorphovibrio marinus]